MKRIMILMALAMGAMALAPMQTYAQQDKKAVKAEKKRWKKKAKTYVKNPLALKAREEAFAKELEELQKRLKECQKRNGELQAELDECAQKAAAEIRQYKYKYDSLYNEFKRLSTAYESTRGATTSSDVTTVKGLYYRVQVGAYQKFNMNRHLEYTDESFTGESADNLNKYMMGRFKTYALAEAFRNDIRKLGIKDAWVVAYNDGVRIDIKEAQRIQSKQK
jgi:hypothetical protein